MVHTCPIGAFYSSPALSRHLSYICIYKCPLFISFSCDSIQSNSCYLCHFIHVTSKHSARRTFRRLTTIFKARFLKINDFTLPWKPLIFWISKKDWEKAEHRYVFHDNDQCSWLVFDIGGSDESVARSNITQPLCATTKWYHIEFSHFICWTYMAHAF